MNRRFPVSSLLAMLMRVIGGILVVLGLWSVAEYCGILHSGNPLARFGLEGGALGILIGLGLVTVGEIVAVLLAIEANTRPPAHPKGN